MNSKKSKQTENNENLCPLRRKRIKSTTIVKSTPNSTWKLAAVESSSSPSALPTDYLDEMGIGMLDSEESSSSAASAIALAVSASGDENSNEATPNLDAPKFCHQRMIYRSNDNSFENSIDNQNNSFIDPNDTIKSASMAVNNVHRNYNNNNERIQQMQHKKVAILGAGAAHASATLSSTTTTATTSALSSPSSLTETSLSGRVTRSPLSIVACNNINQQPMQFRQVLPSVNSTPHAIVGSSYQSHSPSMPSTSHQAALFKRQQQQQQLLQLQQQEQSQQQYQQCNFIPLQEFFLFRPQTSREYMSDGRDHFSTLSDEIILQIFKWLPKKALIRCSYVCRRFNRCARDESLWTRLDLGGRALRACALENILTRGVVILRLAQAELNHPVFGPEFLQNEPNFETKLQYLDLSMVSVTKPSLKLLFSHCRQLKKLSLEHVPVNDDICNEVAKNVNLEALNLAMCIGLNAWSVRKMMETLVNLTSLNISWTNLSVDAVTSIVTNVTPNLMRLNLAGCRKTMFDSHLVSLAKRCPQLLELDLSDCTGLTGNAINIICKFKMLEYLSLSRCYLIPASSYMDLNNLPTLAYLDVFGMLSDTAMELLEQNFPNLGINKFIHSSVARPTVGTRRTSIWGLRTRD